MATFTTDEGNISQSYQGDLGKPRTAESALDEIQTETFYNTLKSYYSYREKDDKFLSMDAVDLLDYFYEDRTWRNNNTISMGVDMTLSEDMEVELDPSGLNDVGARYELVKTMRASVLVWGALLGRFGKARISFPGGCAIGDRPIDEHIKAFESLGYTTIVDKGYLETNRISKTGGLYKFNTKSVTGSENAIIASILADKDTILSNCSMEPEVADLINFLNLLGAKIKNTDDKILISSVTGLNTKNKVYTIIPDRIEAGTFAVLGSIPGNNLKIIGCDTEHLELPLKIIEACGSRLEIKKNEILDTNE